MKPDIISKLEKDFDIEITQLQNLSKRENSFDLDEQNNVTSLHLHDLEIDSLDFIRPLNDHLKELSITGTSIENISILEDFTRLEYLNLSYNPLINQSLSSLRKLKLKQLHLRCTRISDTTVLGEINDLEKLFLGGSDLLEDIVGLEGLTNLIQLEINHTNISSFKNVHVGNSLRFLSAESTINKISGLERFPHLEELYLMSHYFEKIEGLDHLSSLKRLNLFGTGLSEIEGLDNLTNLEVLDIGDNEISEIKGLENLKKLKKLSIGFNELKAVKNLDGLSQLEYLLLDGNYITEFNPNFLLELEKDCTVSICHNPIKKINGIIPSNVRVEFESERAVLRTLF